METEILKQRVIGMASLLSEMISYSYMNNLAPFNLTVLSQFMQEENKDDVATGILYVFDEVLSLSWFLTSPSHTFVFKPVIEHAKTIYPEIQELLKADILDVLIDCDELLDSLSTSLEKAINANAHVILNLTESFLVAVCTSKVILYSDAYCYVSSLMNTIYNETTGELNEEVIKIIHSEFAKLSQDKKYNIALSMLSGLANIYGMGTVLQTPWLRHIAEPFIEAVLKRYPEIAHMIRVCEEGEGCEPLSSFIHETAYTLDQSSYEFFGNIVFRLAKEVK